MWISNLRLKPATRKKWMDVVNMEKLLQAQDTYVLLDCNCNLSNNNNNISNNHISSID
jgi:hypothetical protein